MVETRTWSSLYQFHPIMGFIQLWVSFIPSKPSATKGHVPSLWTILCIYLRYIPPHVHENQGHDLFVLYPTSATSTMYMLENFLRESKQTILSYHNQNRQYCMSTRVGTIWQSPKELSTYQFWWENKTK